MAMFQQMKRLFAGKPVSRRRRKSDSNPIAALERLEDRQLLTSIGGMHADVPRVGTEVYGDFDGNGVMDRARRTAVIDQISVRYTSFESGMVFGGGRVPVYEHHALNTSDEFGADTHLSEQFAAGDFNGDGFDDLVMGERDRNFAVIVFGSSEGLDLENRMGIHTGNELYHPTGELLSKFTFAVGDFSRDGITDLAIGWPESDQRVGGHAKTRHKGAVGVLYGDRNMGEFQVEDLQFWREAENGLGGDASDTNDRFGAALTAADFNGDGADDLAVGVPGEVYNKWQLRTQTGAVHVIYGGDTGLTSDNTEYLQQDRAGIGESKDTYDYFGSRLTNGDLDGDGFADLVVGVPGEDYDGAESAGVVHVIYGRSSGLAHSRNQIISRKSAGLNGDPQAGERFGDVVVTGDFNNDGRDELVIGAPGYDYFDDEDTGQLVVASTSNQGIVDRYEIWDRSRLGRDPFRNGEAGTSLMAADANFDGWLDLKIHYDDYLYGSASGLSTREPSAFFNVFAGVLDPTMFAPISVTTNSIGQQFLTIHGSFEDDEVRARQDGNDLHIFGQNGNTIFEKRYDFASVAGIRFDGGQGHDYFENRTSIRTIALGGDGNDTLIGGSGDDYIDGMDGYDSIFGGYGNDRLLGGRHDDFIFGEQGYDTLFGWYGNDTLDGGTENDTLLGEQDHDLLLGGDGDDYADGGDGHDTLYGMADNDRLLGGHGHDHIEGGDGHDVLFGYYGDDSLFGGDGNDELHGEHGNDLIDGGADDDWIQGWDGHDTLFGGSGNDWIDGWWGNDWIFGGSGNDVLHGGGNDDVIKGEQGNDEIRGWDGNDILYGGIGNDWIDGWDGHDTIYGEEGHDTLHGGSGDDTISGGGGDDWADGWTGNDSVRGGTGNDTLHGGTGHDTMDGEDGHDAIFGWQGNDRIYGGRGDDYIDGHDGDDAIWGEDGFDRIFGGWGHDFLNGGNDVDHIYGWYGNDTMFGEGGDDIMYGEDGNDRMYGGSGNDRLNGGNHDDSLYGDDGADVLLGANGNDYMNGGRDYYHDYLHGGYGYDTVVYHEGYYWDYAYDWERVYRYTPWGTFVGYA